jgi:hypothetical protein
MHPGDKMTARSALLSALYGLTPTDFENVVYDLVSAAGLRNPVWRTPGADGGRDIEGDYPVIDFSGYHSLIHWYVECKRYDKSVDWPTVWAKIAYAENHRADCLLFVTTAALSPQCKTELTTRNAQRRRPEIRFWDATVIEQILLRYPSVLIKHGLSKDPRLAAISFLSLAQQSSKVTQSAYGLSETLSQENPALEAAAALSELLTVRMRDVETSGKMRVARFDRRQDEYEWLTASGDLSQLEQCDRYGLRAVLSLIRHITATKLMSVVVSGDGIRITCPATRVAGSAVLNLLTEVAMWGELELRIDGPTVIIQPRSIDG